MINIEVNNDALHHLASAIESLAKSMRWQTYEKLRPDNECFGIGSSIVEKKNEEKKERLKKEMELSADTATLRNQQKGH